MILRGLDQRQRVLGKAGAAIAGAGMEKFGADALVHADAARDILHIGADLFAQVGDFVDEGDLGRQKRVGGVFDQFRAAPVDEIERRLVEVERTIDLAHHFAGARIADADDDAVGPLEIVDRRAFAQKFRIRTTANSAPGAGFGDDPLDLVAGSDRHGRFGDDDGKALDRLGDVARGGVDIGEIGDTVAAPRRRADGDEDDFRPGDGGGEVGGEGKAAVAHIGRDQSVEAGFEDRDFARRSRASMRVGSLSTQTT